MTRGKERRKSCNKRSLQRRSLRHRISTWVTGGGRTDGGSPPTPDGRTLVRRVGAPKLLLSAAAASCLDGRSEKGD